jgi:hypothetical protein
MELKEELSQGSSGSSMATGLQWDAGHALGSNAASDSPSDGHALGSFFHLTNTSQIPTISYTMFWDLNRPRPAFMEPALYMRATEGLLSTHGLLLSPQPSIRCCYGYVETPQSHSPQCDDDWIQGLWEEIRVRCGLRVAPYHKIGGFMRTGRGKLGMVPHTSVIPALGKLTQEDL